MEPIFTGNGRIFTGKYGIIPKFSLTKKDLKRLEQYLDDNGFEWVTVELLEKKEKVEGKPTHYAQIDRYRESQGQGQQPAPAQKSDPSNIYIEGPERARYSGGNLNITENEESSLPF